MRRLILLASLLLSTPAVATAQPSGAYKLIIASSEGGMVIVDYPSSARCERARLTIEEDMQRRTEESDASLPPGAIITSYGWRARAICIPA